METNRLIRTGLGFDAVTDAAAAFARADDPAHPKALYTGPDHMHPSPTGGRAMADAIDLDFFARGL